jgi:hypothetical protein
MRAIKTLREADCKIGVCNVPLLLALKANTQHRLVLDGRHCSYAKDKELWQILPHDM